MISYSVKLSGMPTRADLENLLVKKVEQYIGIIFRTAVKLSPVYTGAFRASWRVSLNAPRSDVSEGYEPENPRQGAVFEWPSTFKLGDAVIVSNNQPYAELIEFGRLSEQAPSGVLRLAIARAGLAP